MKLLTGKEKSNEKIDKFMGENKMSDDKEIKKLIEEIRTDANKIGNYSGYCKEKINILNNVRKIEQLLGIKREGE